MINRLRSLELQGYKTFANKTLFNFPGQVTAVVGPNGSGKSNIADAIRWVLGEQAFSVLRGKKTEDMIFSGSEQKPRASMAAVSIGFDNQSGWLPVDFTEVVITRRAYRNGENEYLLNNQKVRLKDVNELLANSGLGDRTYTIIGQGLVDSALSLRPEERRRFFEEAAGIGLYRSRREEAVSKLDKTLRNMDRVTDILGEISPRLSSLEKNREKALQYNQIQDDLFVLLKDWYGYFWHSAMKDLQNAVAFHETQKENLDQKRDEKNILEENLIQIQKHLSENRENLANLHRELSELHREREDNTRLEAVLEEREESLKLRVQDINNMIATLEYDKESLIAEIAQLEKNHSILIEENHAADRRLKSSEKSLVQKVRTQTEITAAINIKRREINEIQTNIIKFESDKKIQHEQIHKLKNDKASNEGLVDKKLKEHSVVCELIDKIENEIKDLTAKINDFDQMVDNQNKEIESFTEKRSELTADVQQIEIKKSRFAAELEIILEDEKSFSEFRPGLQAIQEAKNKGKIDSEFHLLIDYLDVPEQYEQCISSALGDLVQGIVLDEGQLPNGLLNYIEKEALSRVNIIQPGRNNVDSKPDNSLLIAADLVNANNGIADRIRVLLRSTIVVENRELAIDLLPRISAGWKIVTHSGEVFDTNGVISAGVSEVIKPVKKKREKKIIENEIRSLEKTSEKLIEELNQIDNKLQILRNRLQDSKKNKELLSSEIQTLEFENHKKDLEKTQIEKVIQECRFQIDQDSKQVVILEETIPDFQYQIENQIQSIDTLKQEEQVLIEQLAAIDTEKERVELVELTSKKAVAEQIANQSQAKIKENQANLDNLKFKLDQHYLNLKTNQENLEKTQSERRQLIEKNILIAQHNKELNQKIKPIEEIVESVIGEQSKLLEEVDKSRQEFSQAERYFLQSQMKVEKLENNLDVLRNRIAEEFGLISGDAGPKIPMSIPLPFEELSTSLPLVINLPEEFEDTIKQKKSFLRRLGPINPDAEREYNEVSERYHFLQDQLKDLESAEDDLRKVVDELDNLMESKFVKTFKDVDREFQVIFSQLFNGGQAKLFIEEEENILNSGIEIEATLPGRRRQELALLSGGERSLTAVALIFALLRISPTPFCVLDEVDAMLDESNVVRFGELLRELSDDTQFIVITHNRNTVQLADVLYGVTMGRDSVSQVISLRLDELTEELVN